MENLKRNRRNARRKNKRRRKREQFKQYLFVMRELTGREIKRRYTRSSLGILWSVLNPLLSMAVLSLIFTQLFQRKIENFPVYYLTGYLLWQMFTNATNSAMTALADNRILLTRVKFPVEVFVLARIYTAVVNLGYSLPAYTLLLFVFGIRPGMEIVLVPCILIFLLLFSTGLAFLLAGAYVFFGDIKHLYSVILTLWMYCSALFYPADELSGMIRKVIELNPMFQYIQAMREVVMYGQMPSFGVLISGILWGVAAGTAGYGMFRKNKNKMMQKI